MTGQAIVVRGNALNLPIEDESVDLIITSPPYFALRSYRDEGEHYDGQIGSEPTPKEFLEALWAATREMVRVLKPTGSIWVNLGDKYAGSGPRNNENFNERWHGSTAVGRQAQEQGRPDSVMETRKKTLAGSARAKSLMGLPWRYAIGCIDDLGLILRAEVVWSKPNGLPESVQDRVRRSHEQWFMFTKEPRYFAAVDEVREPHSPITLAVAKYVNKGDGDASGNDKQSNWGGYSKGGQNPLGKLPGSVWTIPSEPLIVPEWARTKYNLPDHFAAFPQEWPRRIILGWSPSGVCVECGEGRRPVVDKSLTFVQKSFHSRRKHVIGAGPESPNHIPGYSEATITGYACACTPYTDHPGTKEPPGLRTGQGYADETGRSKTSGGMPKERFGPHREYHLDNWTPPETKPAVVLDPFSGTGTVPLVARQLGRTGIGVDLSFDYSRLARWRVFESGHGKKALARTWAERQTELL